MNENTDTREATIRAEIRHEEALPEPCPGCLAEAALDALVAERDRLDKMVEKFYKPEIERLQAALERELRAAALSDSKEEE